MAGELETPIDPLSGLPYLIAPLGGGDITRHHLWHPSDDPLFKTLAGQALRGSILQDADASIHNYGPASYHARYAGPKLPETPEEAFAPCFFASAGALPRFCIDFSGAKPVERELTRAEIAYLQTPNPHSFGYLHLGQGYPQLREFFKQIIFGQDVSQLNEDTIDKFLNHPVEKVRVYAGHKLLKSAARLAVGEDLQRRYLELRRLGLVYHRLQNPQVRPRPAEVVIRKLGQKWQRTELFPALADLLLAS